MDRISFTVLQTTAADTVVTATGILPPAGPADLEALHPARHRHRVKARTRKNPTSKYGPNAGQHPTTSQNYTLHTTIASSHTDSQTAHERKHNGADMRAPEAKPRLQEGAGQGKPT
ncbi:hypothetical protein ACFU9X_36230 [Streptomyces atratus]|uniref:hypothetical protein n=1 Tax=Streptomyces atratus TaxID=1893 RepID=UPI00368B2836